MPSIVGRIAGKIRRTLHPIVDISDEYTDLLIGVNAGWLERGNLCAISHAIENLPSGAPIVEIGTFCGLSTNIIHYYKLKYGRENRLINCDKWEWNSNGNVGDSAVSISEYLAFAMDSYKRSVQIFSRENLPYTVKEFSDDFFRLWRASEEATDIFGRQVILGGPISFGFIDGNHDYDFAKRDFLNTDEFLEPGGFILFDDSSDDSPWEVTQVRDEVLLTNRYEVVMKNPNYLFRKK